MKDEVDYEIHKWVENGVFIKEPSNYGANDLTNSSENVCKAIDSLTEIIMP